MKITNNNLTTTTVPANDLAFFAKWAADKKTEKAEKALFEDAKKAGLAAYNAKIKEGISSADASEAYKNVSKGVFAAAPPYGSTDNLTTTNEFTNNAEFWLAYDAAFQVFKEAGFTDNSDDVAVDALAAAGAAAKAYATWEDVADTVDAAWTAAALAAKSRVNPKTAAKEYKAAVAAEKTSAAAVAVATDRFYGACPPDKQNCYTTYKVAAASAAKARIKVVAAKIAVDTQRKGETLTLDSADGRTFVTSLIGLEILGWCFDGFPHGQDMADAAYKFRNSEVSIRCQEGEFSYSIDGGDYQPSGDDTATLGDLNLLSKLGDLTEVF
jgi:hypothetical protein